MGRNVIARDKVLYHGHAVAAVAATTPLLAEQALDAIKVDYDVLEPVLSIDQAIADGATLVNEAMHTNGDASQPASNIAAITKFERGDPEQGFAEARHCGGRVPSADGPPRLYRTARLYGDY